jgi:hypothetical protein
MALLSQTTSPTCKSADENLGKLDYTYLDEYELWNSGQNSSNVGDAENSQGKTNAGRPRVHSFTTSDIIT